MPRFFAFGANFKKGPVLLSAEDAEHVRALRLRLGDRLIICDGGDDHVCRISHINGAQIGAELIESHAAQGEPTVKCCLLCAMPKGERADYIVQKCTESGADEICFFFSERCVSRPEGSALEKKLARLQKIAREAAQQSGRGKVPTLSFLKSLALAVDHALNFELPLMLYESGADRIPLKAALTEARDFSSCAVITGPEGGFELFEAVFAKAAGLKLCSIGPRIFRCETAPVAAAVAVMYHTGNLN